MAFYTGYEITFLINAIVSLIAGILIGAERESRGKPAGISTHSLVIGGAMIFAFMSSLVDPGSKTRIAAQIVSGIGFLGAGIILKGDNGAITNLTTAASLWFAASIGMAIGFGWYIVAIIATVYSMLVPRIPHVKKIIKTKDDDK